MELKSETTIIGATSEYGTPIEVVDEGSTVFAYGDEPYGSVCLIITADSWEAAYDAAIDALPTIDPADLPEAYGYDTQKELDAACAAAPDSCVDLAEGYCYQSNFTGTGIVNEGHYAWLWEVDAEWLMATGVRLAIRHYDDVPAEAV